MEETWKMASLSPWSWRSSDPTDRILQVGKSDFPWEASFLETACEGSRHQVYNLAFRAPNDAMFVIYSHIPGKAFFSL